MSKDDDLHTHTLIINGREKPYEGKKAGYTDIVQLAYPSPDFTKYDYDVTYFRGQSEQEGDLLDTDPPVPVRDKMVFNVRRSDKS
jgi:hypothetical protein